jgi:hypothetical protein
MHHSRTARRRTALAGLTTAGLLAALVGAGASQASTHVRAVAPTHPGPSHFTRGRVDNPWFPLKPGTRYVYRGVEGGTPFSDVMIATYRTRVVDGVTCRVVLDRVFVHRRMRERTFDWYAQTRAGTVWYFGERTTTFDRHGDPTGTAGSFTSGVDGAEAGIFMTPHPHPGPTYHQESFPGQAEDEFTVVRRGAAVSTPLLASRQALLTREFSPIEPGIVEHKYYVRNVGDVRDITVKGGIESSHLVSLTHVARR